MQIWEGLKRLVIPSEHNAYRPKILHRTWLLFFLALVLGSEGFLVANLVARQGDQNFLAAVVPAEIVALTNTERAQNDVGQLTTNALLTQAAQAKAEDMAAKGYFSHVAPDGTTPWQWFTAAGYQYQYAGENLAVQFVNSSDVVNAWMASPTHRDNMVKPVYTQIGVGVAQGLFQGQMATYVVQFFGTPLASAATEPAAVAAAPPAATQSSQGTAPEVSSASQGQVEAASVSPTPPASQGSSLVQSLSRQIMRALGEPELATNWILGLVALILVIALALTILMHAHIQPMHTLMQASVVALFALSFLYLNTRLVSTNTGSLTPQDQAASIGYSLFPN